MRLNAHAKINLALAVGPPQPPSGYHPISSWFVPIDLHDVVAVSPAPHSSFSINWAPDAPRTSPIDWPTDKDLARRAHLAFEAALGRPCPAAITVSKRIPVGGGLGGASTDAAAVLRALRELFAPHMTEQDLVAIAATLGSDVAYFCDTAGPAPRQAIVEGLGERIERTRAVGGSLLLVVPPFGCATRDVYRAFDSAPDAANGFAERASRVRSLQRAALTRGLCATPLFNDLADPACTVAPPLRAIARDLGALLDRPAHITGSGSCLFVPALHAELFALAPRARAASPTLRSCTFVECNIVEEEEWDP